MADELTKEEIHKCYYCGKEDGIGWMKTPEFHEGLLYIHNSNLSKEGRGDKNTYRELTCPECHKRLAKAGQVACPARYNHHLYSTCNVCGQVG